MPREKDDERLALLRRILADPVVVIFRAKALSGGERRDEGASNLLPRHANEGERGLRTFVRIELLEFLRRGGQPNRVEVGGDDVRGDAAVFYEFRLEIEGVRLYIKAELKCDDPVDPILIVKSVKKQD
ncbi:MAG TPA: hypothetical protein PK920_07160 [Phycisphaerae bacterium]|jgi:hypothetical protein|nr:hypothetical protein [Phycisphaerae bacterium]HRS27481.1 hypothetical protein [Phycisphaerae bacterium]HRT40528.1 hypothetical protein [Phycisphaerae bacterium]